MLHAPQSQSLWVDRCNRFSSPRSVSPITKIHKRVKRRLWGALACRAIETVEIRPLDYIIENSVVSLVQIQYNHRHKQRPLVFLIRSMGDSYYIVIHYMVVL
jgi:hypothetical protein